MSLSYLVDLLVRGRDTKAVQTELLVGVPLPTQCGKSLDRQDRDAIRKNLQLVCLVLGIEDLEAGNGNHTGNNALLLEYGSSIDADADLGTSGNESDGCIGYLHEDVTTLQGILNGRVLELRQVLTSESENARSVLGGESRVISSAGLISIGRAPDHNVGQSAKVGQSLNGLVGRAILTEADRVVGTDVNSTDARQSRQTDSTRCVRNEVKKGSSSRNNSAICSKTVHDSSHAMFTNTITKVTTRPFTNAILRRLEVDGILPAGVVGASQVSGAGKQLRDGAMDLLENSFGELTRCNRRVARLVGWQVLLPALGKLTRQTADKISMLSLVFRSVLLEKLVPFLLLGSAFSSVLGVEVVNLLGDIKGLLRIETEALLDVLGVISLQRVAVHTTSTLQLGAITDSGGHLDDGRLVRNRFSLLNGSGDALKVVVTVLDPQGMPTIGLKALQHILSEGALGVTVYVVMLVYLDGGSVGSNDECCLTDGNMVVIVDGNQVAELQVASKTGSFTSNTLHSTSITEDSVCVVVEEVISGLVEDRSSVSLGDGKTDCVGETLAERSSGDLNAGSVVRLGVTRGKAIQLLVRR